MGVSKCNMCWTRRFLKSQNCRDRKSAGKANGLKTRSQLGKVARSRYLLLGVQSTNV